MQSIFIRQGQHLYQSAGKAEGSAYYKDDAVSVFPTDAQAPLMAVCTVADGTAVFVENIFDNRYRHVSELLRMGAKIKTEGRVAVVQGVRRLSAAELVSPDLRGGAALVIAALCAEGTSTIGGISHIDRGYEAIEKSLYSVGADIRRI